MKQKKILLLSVSAGAGHMRAAEAIRAHADTHEAGIAATHLDVMNFVPAGFRKLYTDFYIGLVNRHPALWGYLYQLTNNAQPDGSLQRLRRGIERLNTRALLREIIAFDADAIICTHFLPAEILSRMKRNGSIRCPIWVQVTDFDLHRMWVHEQMAGYFAASDEVAYRMRALGIPPHTVHVTGIPIMPSFGQVAQRNICLLYTSPSPRDGLLSRMPSSA